MGGVGGGGGGPFRTPKIPQDHKQIIRTKIVYTSGTFFEKIAKNHKKYFLTMFPYRVKYTESEYDIQNNDLSYKINQKYQNTFEHFGKYRKQILIYYVLIIYH